MVYLCPMEYYSDTEMNEILLHATTWMKRANMVSKEPDIKVTYDSINMKWSDFTNPCR